MSKHLAVIVGTRPNFIKIVKLLEWARDLKITLIHTGQHYDDKMSRVFFDQLGFKPDIYLNAEQKKPLAQIGEVMSKLEELFPKLNPDMVMVVGDVNSTLAGAIAANRLGIKLAHLESGLRSNDRGMPEEINRILTDRIADVSFVTEPSGMENLIQEGKDPNTLYYVGNTMIDTLVGFNEQIDEAGERFKHNIKDGEYAVVTLHRPANVDNLDGIERILAILKMVSSKCKLIFPIHPRTKRRFTDFGIDITQLPNLILTEPLGYLQFQELIKFARFILTDSGGIQEESTYRKVPCITLRENTERPVTLTIGSNILTGLDKKKIEDAVSSIEKKQKKYRIPELWDGQASKRILKILNDIL